MDVAGSPQNPETTMTFHAPRRGVQSLLPAAYPNEITFAFGPRGDQVAGTPLPHEAAPAVALAVASRASVEPPEIARAEPPPPPPAPEAELSTPAPTGFGAVTAVDAAPGGDGTVVRISLRGNVTYEWRRLPDDRWYIDLKGAILSGLGQEIQIGGSALKTVRYKQFISAPRPWCALRWSRADRDASM